MFLNYIYCPKQNVPTLPFQMKYFKFPYLGPSTSSFDRSLKEILRKLTPQIDFNFVYINNNSIGNFFQLKDRIPTLLRSSVVYKFKCQSCNALYVGQTRLHLKQRISKHCGVSFRTNQPLLNPEHSNIRSHSHSFNHSVSESDFNVLDSSNSMNSLKFLESLYINQLKPAINDRNSSNP